MVKMSGKGNVGRGFDDTFSKYDGNEKFISSILTWNEKCGI